MALDVTFYFTFGVGSCSVEVKYHGRAAHASAYPWEGLNALDAAVLAYSNISVLRQQLRTHWRINGELRSPLYKILPV